MVVQLIGNLVVLALAPLLSAWLASQGVHVAAATAAGVAVLFFIGACVKAAEK